MNGQIFDDWTDAYEAMVDWPKRLAHEEPFYRRLFERVGVRSLVDVACGTGHHAAMFRLWGLRVEGADVSSNMVERARASFGERPGLRWVVRGFDEPVEPDEPFDAAICVGNSLALAPDKEAAFVALGQMLWAVRPGGVVVVHLLNLWRLPDGPCVWQKCQRVALPQGKVLLIKGVHRCGAQGHVDLMAVPLPEANRMQTDSATLLGFEAPEIEAAARRAGAARVDCFGDYRDGPYVRETSTDLIVVAERGDGSGPSE